MGDLKFGRREVLTGVAATAMSLARPTALLQSASASLAAGGIATNVEVLGYAELAGRPAFKLAIAARNGRWYLYTGHFWDRGWSVVDVTDPARAEVVNFLPGPANSFGGQVDLHGDIMITSLERALGNAPWGLDPNGPFEEGVLIWSLVDPARPRLLSHYRTGGTGTHRNGYQGGRYMHLSAAIPGYSGNIYQIVDISDPARPKEAGRWAVPGQQKVPGAMADQPPSQAQRSAMQAFGIDPSAAEAVHQHGPPVIVGDQAWLAYGGAGLIVLDIRDVARPRLISRLAFSPPFHAQFGVHGVLPVPRRGIAFANSEDTSYGKGPAHHASIVDIHDPARPKLLSLLPEPVPPKGAPYRNFAEKGGWSGPHNMNHLQHNPDVQQQGDLFYLAHFNAGLRIYDTADPRLPREVGSFLPPEPRRRYGPMPEGRLVTQTEDVLVDRRGVIYISDKNQGLWMLRYTG